MSRTSFQNAGAEPLLKPEGTQRVGRLAIWWLSFVEIDLGIMGLRNWRPKSQDRDQWRAIIKYAKDHHGLQRPQKKKRKKERKKHRRVRRHNVDIHSSPSNHLLVNCANSKQ
jgi:hypothetical protein